MHIKLKLSQKVLMLVAVPIAFELFFLITLASLVERAEKEALRAAHLKDVISETNGLVTKCYEIR